MSNLDEITKIVSPVDVALRYLGQPNTTRGNKLWYKSPFRNERTASLMVDEKSFHDFGDNWDGGIFDFVQRYYQVNLPEAIKIIKSDFGLADTFTYSEEYKKYLALKSTDKLDLNMRNIHSTVKHRFITSGFEDEPQLPASNPNLSI